MKQVREEKGVTKVAVARHLGITDKTYASYEDNPQRMRVDTAMKVADFLGVAVDTIFFGWDSN